MGCGTRCVFIHIKCMHVCFVFLLLKAPQVSNTVTFQVPTPAHFIVLPSDFFDIFLHSLLQIQRETQQINSFACIAPY